MGIISITNHRMESMASFSFMEYVYMIMYIYIYIWTSPKCGYFPSRMGRFGPQCRMYCQMAASRGDAQSILTILTNPLHNRVLIIHNPTKTLKSYESYPFTHHWSQFHRRLFITLSSRNNFTHVPSWILLSSSIHPISPQKKSHPKLGCASGSSSRSTRTPLFAWP